MFVVLSLCSFSFESPTFPYELKIETGKVIGYLPVYNTYEDAKADYPDGQIREIGFIEEVVNANAQS